MTIPVLVVTGPVGVGKTTTASAVVAALEHRGVPHASIDVDGLSWCYPTPADDPFNSRLVYRNLTDVCRNMVAAGAERLILPYVIEDRAGRDAIAACVPDAELTVVRLTAEPETITRRLRGREADEADESLAWHLARAPELTAIMERNGVGDHVVETDGRTPEELAVEILGLVGW